VTKVTGAFVLLVLPVLARAQSEALSPAYEAAVRRYASGDRDGAIAEMCAWPEGLVRDEIAALRRRARSDDPWQGTRLTAALMLHTDCALRARRDGRSPRLQEWAAVELVSLMKDDPARRAFARRWYEAMAGLAQGETRWGDALDWAERGLRDFPDSAEMLLIVGSIEEMVAVQAAPPSSGRLQRADQRQTGWSLARLREARQQLQRARRTLRQAIAAEPALHEARLREGRVAWRLGEAAEARSALLEVLARRPAAEVAYLAHLFLGRIQEDEGRLDEAVRSYEATLALDATAQSARLALSHVLLELGDAAAARRGVETAVQAAGRRQVQDAFWLYPCGLVSLGVEDRLEALRREASR
jgi:tetratricopeptide (TPR) repeat protein